MYKSHGAFAAVLGLLKKEHAVFEMIVNGIVVFGHGQVEHCADEAV